MLTLLLSATAGAQDCPDLDALVTQAEDAVIEARFDDTADLVTQAEEALACRELADHAVVARLFLVLGARLALAGAAEDSSRAFASAWRVSPETWNVYLGPAMRQAYDAARERPPEAGTIRLAPEPEGLSTALDGEMAAFPVDTAAGPHLVQVLGEDGAARYARIVDVLPGGIVTLELDAMARPPAVSERRRFPTLLVAGSASALLAGGTAALALHQNTVMADARTSGALEAAFRRQQVLAWSTWGLAGLAATGVTLHFVW